MATKTSALAGGGSTRRRRFLVNPKFQLTIIGFNLVLAILAIMIFYLENIYLFDRFLQSEGSELMQDTIIAEMIAEEARRMKMIFALTAVAVIATMITGGLILSNRVAGPIYRLDKHIKDVLSGKTNDDVRFRDKDYFMELAITFNKFMELYRKKTGAKR